MAHSPYQDWSQGPIRPVRCSPLGQPTETATDRHEELSMTSWPGATARREPGSGAARCEEISQRPSELRPGPPTQRRPSKGVFSAARRPVCPGDRLRPAQSSVPGCRTVARRPLLPYPCQKAARSVGGLESPPASAIRAAVWPPQMCRILSGLQFGSQRCDES